MGTGDSSSTLADSAEPGWPQPLPINAFKLTCAEAQFIRYLNLYRVANGKTKLYVSKSGVEAGRWHAQDMIEKDYFAHTEPSGRSFSSRCSAFGYPAWSENIAGGSHTAEQTFCMWKRSAGHNRNMLADHHISTGIGRASGGGRWGVYWSSNFGSSTQDLIDANRAIEGGCSLPVTLPSC